MKWRLGKALVVAACFTLWWYPVLDYIDKPQTIRVGVFLLLTIIVALFFHAKAFSRFARMLGRIRYEEDQGIAESGSTLFAGNQKFRYGMRIIEATWGIGVGVLAVMANYYPQIQTNKEYGKVVVTYFLGTIIVTGYLTIRDLHVINVLRKMDNDDTAQLTTIKHSTTRGDE